MQRLVPYAVLAVGLAVTAAPARAERSWDHAANVRSHAKRTAELQKVKGALGTFEFIESCYKTHSLATEFNPALEGCMVVDYLHSVSLATVYARMSAEQRAEAKVPEPDAITKSMGLRLAATFQQYKLSKERFEAFGRLVERVGVPEYSKSRFTPVP